MTHSAHKKASSAKNKSAEKPSSAPKSLLDKVNNPADLKSLSDKELKILANDVRADLISSVSQTGGHLGAGLGVVELTVALHAIFDTPKDKLIWDVGHQCYPHKILTERRTKMQTIRQGGGLSGFTKRSESEYDPFGAGHSSTSISAGLGMAIARDFSGEDKNIIAVIGDGSMSAGMAYEAMNNAGALKSRLIVILNDNAMSISPPVGALSNYLPKLVSSRGYIKARETGKKITEILPQPLRHAAKRAEESARTAMGHGSLFEEMGFYYIGPIDGHNLDHLLPVLRNVKESNHQGPILIHAITQKGFGYEHAENAADKMHGVVKFDISTGAQKKSKPAAPAYTKIFAGELVKQAEKDEKIIGITAAMDTGTGMDIFAKSFPERMFDVGIAEQHAVTFAAGLAAEGYKPFCAIYSTFLQRAYDQLVHDVCIQNLPVRFAMDRAGLVGADGATHAGSFDIAYLSCLPNIVLMAPSDEAELMHMTATAAAYDAGPIAFRYPRGEGTGAPLPEKAQILEIGKGRIVKETKLKNASKRIAILSYGTMLQEALLAANMLGQKNISTTIADARFAKPLDEKLVQKLVKEHDMLITIEEGSAGGFGSLVLNYAAQADLLQNCRFKTMHLPDIYQDHNSQQEQLNQAGLTAEHIVKKALS